MEHPLRLPWKHGHVEHIAVTVDHMLRGQPGSCRECAVSLAVKEHFAANFPGTRWEVSVDDHSVGVWECDSGLDMWGYQHNAKHFISNYDDLANSDYWCPEPDSFWALDTIHDFDLELRT